MTSLIGYKLFDTICVLIKREASSKYGGHQILNSCGMQPRNLDVCPTEANERTGLHVDSLHSANCGVVWMSDFLCLVLYVEHILRNT